MPIRLSTATRNAVSNTVAALTASGKIEVRTGAQPASANSAATGTILVTFPVDSTPFGSASGGDAALADTPLTATAAASGVAGWFRFYDSSNGTVMDGECGTTTGQLRLSVTDITAGVQVTIASGKITQVAGS